MASLVEKIIAGVIAGVILLIISWITNKKGFLRFGHKIKHGNLDEFFAIIKKNIPEINEMKIIANVTNLAMPAFKISKLKANNVKLLLRKSENISTEKNNQYKYYLKGIVEDWEKLKSNNIIQNLNIRYFDFTTPDWQVIIDDKYMIMGLNIPSKDDWKRFEVMDVILMKGGREPEKSMIKKYSERFDKFYNDYGVSS